MTQEKLANELNIDQSTLGRWLKENSHNTAPMNGKAIKAAREHFKHKQETKPKLEMNRLCKGCPNGYKSDLTCASNGNQRRCPVYRYNREKRRKKMARLSK